MRVLLWLHIFRRSNFSLERMRRKWGILNTVNDYEELNENRIVFSFFKNDFSKYLNASANIPKRIIFSYEWAVQLVLSDSKEVLNAFTITVGHELTHKRGNMRCIGTKSDKQFINWINEVYCDFNASQLMCKGSRELLVRASKYKREMNAPRKKKHILRKPNKDSLTHPSWNQRVKYAENFNFDENLVREIASYLKYNNEKVIQMVCDYYDDIILT